MCKPKLLVSLGLMCIFGAICSTLHAASMRMTLLPGTGESKWLVQLDVAGFTAGSPIYVSASGMRANAKDQMLTAYHWTGDQPYGSAAMDGTRVLRFKQSDWGAFIYEAHDEQGNQAYATLAWDYDGKIVGSISGGQSVVSQTTPGAHDSEYLTRLLGQKNLSLPPSWPLRPVNVRGTKYLNSYIAPSGVWGNAGCVGAFSLGDIRRPGQPVSLDCLLAVTDETPAISTFRVEIRCDGGQAVEYTVRMGQPQTLHVPLTGVGRVEFVSKQLTGPLAGGVALVDPKISY